MPDTGSNRPIVILSNRGPLTFSTDDHGRLIARRGAGGLVSGLAPLVLDTSAIWIAAAMTDADRDAAGQGVIETDGFRFRAIDLDPDLYRMAYDVVCNGTLWFLYHGLFDLARRPRIDSRWREAWAAYEAVNRTFAEVAAAAAPPHAIVLVQDYHLALVGPTLMELRPDVTAVHFSHTPFCRPDDLRVLPDEVAVALLQGMAGHRRAGFHSERWADAFEACCREVAGIDAATFVSPLAPDPADMTRAASTPGCARHLEELEQLVGDRKLIVRVDRVELSKNILRGFHAYDELLERHPEWREKVVFAASVYPSREGLADYLAYRQEAETLVRYCNEKWSRPGWTPILLDLSDDYLRSVAALRRADVVVVNPIRDGLNLVAKEAMLVNDHDTALVLSREAGAWEELGPAGAIGVNPFDVTATSDALLQGLEMSAEERRTRAESLRASVLGRTAADWLADQLAAAD